MRLTTWSCWKSFSPKKARSAPVWRKSFATTVATPSKWPGRNAPHNPSLTPLTDTVVAKPSG